VLRIDLGSVGATRFLGVVGVGFDALVTEEVRAKRHGPLGYHGYALPILRALARYRPPQLRVRIDGEPAIACGFAIVCKLPNYGGLFAVTPDARMDSGHLDLCLFKNASIAGLVGIVWPSWRGTLAKRDDVVVTTATHLAIESIGDEQASVQIDGDAWGKTPIEITVQARVVPMLVSG
jgi:diacylglycerol kinase (ATP)